MQLDRGSRKEDRVWKLALLLALVLALALGLAIGDDFGASTDESFQPLCRSSSPNRRLCFSLSESRSSSSGHDPGRSPGHSPVFLGRGLSFRWEY